MRPNQAPSEDLQKRWWRNDGLTCGQTLNHYSASISAGIWILVNHRQTLHAQPMLVECWSTVCDAGPTLYRHWSCGCIPRQTLRPSWLPGEDPLSICRSKLADKNTGQLHIKLFMAGPIRGRPEVTVWSLHS